MLSAPWWGMPSPPPPANHLWPLVGSVVMRISMHHAPAPPSPLSSVKRSSLASWLPAASEWPDPIFGQHHAGTHAHPPPRPPNKLTYTHFSARFGCGPNKVQTLPRSNKLWSTTLAQALGSYSSKASPCLERHIGRTHPPSDQPVRQNFEAGAVSSLQQLDLSWGLVNSEQSKKSTIHKRQEQDQVHVCAYTFSRLFLVGPSLLAGRRVRWLTRAHRDHLAPSSQSQSPFI